MRRRKKKDGTPPEDDAPPSESVSDDGDGAIPQLPVAWGNVVTDTIKLSDPAGLARRLRSELELGDNRTSYAEAIAALDKSSKNLDDAGRLWRSAVLEEKRYELKAAVRVEIMRSTAMKQLTDEYKNKLRPSPTTQHVEDRILSIWPDEYVNVQMKAAEIHAAAKSLETLHDAWKARCSALRDIVDRTKRSS